MTLSIKEEQRALYEKLLGISIRDGHLPQDSTVEDLTIGVRQRMIDSYLLRDSIEGGYLPQDSTVEDLTIGVRLRMLNDGNFKKYLPDGSIGEFELFSY